VALGPPAEEQPTAITETTEIQIRRSIPEGYACGGRA
jgi:hypothetical protein